MHPGHGDAAPAAGRWLRKPPPELLTPTALIQLIQTLFREVNLCQRCTHPSKLPLTTGNRLNLPRTRTGLDGKIYPTILGNLNLITQDLGIVSMWTSKLVKAAPALRRTSLAVRRCSNLSSVRLFFWSPLVARIYGVI